MTGSRRAPALAAVVGLDGGSEASASVAGLARFRVATLGSAVLLVLIIWTGAAVRLTGSGLGCPKWPTCKDGEVVPARGSHAQIEFGNRVVTGLCLLGAAVAVLGAFRLRPVRRDLRRLAAVVVVGLFANAVVGGMIVLLHLKPISVIAHFLLAIAVLTAGVVLYLDAAAPVPSAVSPGGGGPPMSAGSLWWRSPRSLALLGTGLVAFALGTVVTATGPHGGDPDVERLGFSGRDVARLHSLADWLLLAVIVAVGVLAQREGRTGVVRRASIVLALSIVQGAVGYVQYFRGVPAGLVMVHVVLASLLWCALVVLAHAQPLAASPVTVTNNTRVIQPLS